MGAQSQCGVLTLVPMQSLRGTLQPLLIVGGLSLCEFWEFTHKTYTWRKARDEIYLTVASGVCFGLVSGRAVSLCVRSWGGEGPNWPRCIFVCAERDICMPIFVRYLHAEP